MQNSEAARTVLAADDSPLALTLLTRLLKGEGYRVVTANNGIDAAQQVYREFPDLIVLDIEMPRMNGYQVCRLLKRDPAVAHIPVIILSAVDVRGTEFWSLRTGADAFMAKSAEPAELLATIQMLLAKTARNTPHSEGSNASRPTPGPEEILSSVCALMDEELYASTIERIQLKTIVQNLRDGVLTLNLAGTVTAANQALCDMLGQKETLLKGQPYSEAVGIAAGGSTLSIVRSALSGTEEPEHESELHHPSGTKTPVAISAVPLRDFLGAIVGCVCLFHDITRRKEIEALDKVKNDLTHMIVHDLRTPLTSLMAGLQMLQPLEEDREILEISMAGGRTLLGMINDLLDISKMEEGLMSLDRSNFSLKELFDGAFQQVGWLAEEKGLDLRTEISPEVGLLSADLEKLRRVMVNLIGNAVKFTPTKGHITVTAQIDPLNQEVMVGVRDTGEGIPKEAFERIFEKFEQVETRKAGKTKSTGLGLTFCKLVIEAHGGRIWVESEPGQGSTFFFTIPQPVSGAMGYPEPSRSESTVSGTEFSLR
jgi:PAS domain S-box-containing protein